MAIQDALESGAVRELFVAAPPERFAKLLDRARSGGVPVASISSRLLDVLADTTTPQGVVAVVEAPSFSLEAGLRQATLVVVLAGVRDPGNAGTLVRSAVGAGADAIVFTRGGVDALHPKTLRASGGALWRVPVVRAVTLERCLQALGDAGLVTIATDAAASEPLWSADLTRPLALVLGNEAGGLANDVLAHVAETYAIPMPGSIESLNVAVAGSIFLFEATRQRTSA